MFTTPGWEREIGFEFLDAFELALKGVLVAKVVPIHHLDGPERADDVARQPDLAVGATTDGLEQFVVGDLRRSVCEVCILSARALGNQRARGCRRDRACWTLPHHSGRA